MNIKAMVLNSDSGKIFVDDKEYQKVTPEEIKVLLEELK